MNIPRKRRLILWGGMLLLSLSCSLLNGPPQAGDESDIDAQVMATLTQVEMELKSTRASQTETAQSQPSPSPEPTQTAVPTETPTLTPSVTVPPTVTETPPPQHLATPGSPNTRNTYVSDIITVEYAKDKTAVGDNYVWSRMERPYTAETMEYRDYLDIMRVDMRVRDPWVYITFVLVGDLPERGDVRYAVELDVDHEGRGEYLVTAGLPSTTQWTTEGVLVMGDQDGDVGGVFPLYEETPQPDQNGYEAEIFSHGSGEDPDLAWVRRVPGQNNQVQLAFKRALIGRQGILWSAWTDAGIQDPSLFDFNDHFTFEEAGSPNKGNHRYPLKAVALVDSTCRSWYDFIPTGSEPGLCYVQEQYDPQPPGMGYCVASETGSGCGDNACRVECPGNKLCLPCQR